MTQGFAAAFTAVYTLIVTLIILKVVDATVGLRVTESEEREGLDLASHGENAYND
jgi:Amt family ammonium transporter